VWQTEREILWHPHQASLRSARSSDEMMPHVPSLRAWCLLRITAPHTTSFSALGQVRGLRGRRRQEPDNTHAGSELHGRADVQSEAQATPHSGRQARPDFIVGLSVRRHITGYALLHFEDLLPLQFGIIDVRKAAEAQQKSLEIKAVLRELKQEAPQKLQRALAEGADDRPASGTRQWLVTIDDSTQDRAPATNASQSQSQMQIAMLQGLVIADCRRLFKVAPTLVHPQLSRRHLGARGRGIEARQEVYELAASEIPDFLELRRPSGALNEDALLVSDAWASARFAQRQWLVADRRQDPHVMTKLRQLVLSSKPMRKIKQAVDDLLPRKAGRELEEVMETKVGRQIEDHINRMLDRELERLGEGSAEPPLDDR